MGNVKSTECNQNSNSSASYTNSARELLHAQLRIRAWSPNYPLFRDSGADNSNNNIVVRVSPLYSEEEEEVVEEEEEEGRNVYLVNPHAVGFLRNLAIQNKNKNNRGLNLGNSQDDHGNSLNNPEASAHSHFNHQVSQQRCYGEESAAFSFLENQNDLHYPIALAQHGDANNPIEADSSARDRGILERNRLPLSNTRRRTPIWEIYPEMIENRAYRTNNALANDYSALLLNHHNQFQILPDRFGWSDQVSASPLLNSFRENIFEITTDYSRINQSLELDAPPAYEDLFASHSHHSQLPYIPGRHVPAISSHPDAAGMHPHTHPLSTGVHPLSTGVHPHTHPLSTGVHPHTHPLSTGVHPPAVSINPGSNPPLPPSYNTVLRQFGPVDTGVVSVMGHGEDLSQVVGSSEEACSENSSFGYQAGFGNFSTVFDAETSQVIY
ncbi:uncharacterized protein LOC106167308 [Lingula anatina]|uniref:Uncharacterized protein LOC106167308 n=1 Tax=Lingula anatina TaxID=7574 RepID=A0A1S3ITG9_LINAN|nr:uncharacterized protein LOC106167308 [Lingula anatina]|eukprot:XP_013401505.1 uncharacterized protein LOC106167308 [Lingula anatina]